MGQWEICVIVMVFLLGWNICPNESLTLTSAGSIDGKWKFEEGGAIALKCTIPSYSGYLKWRLSGTDVATCTPQICKQLTTGNGSFTFSFDTSNFIFEWGINPVSNAYNKVIFECFHNITDNANVTAEVQSTATTTTEPTEVPIGIITASLAIACTASFLLIIMLVWWFKKYERLEQEFTTFKITNKPETPSREQTDGGKTGHPVGNAPPSSTKEVRIITPPKVSNHNRYSAAPPLPDIKKQAGKPDGGKKQDKPVPQSGISGEPSQEINTKTSRNKKKDISINDSQNLIDSTGENKTEPGSNADNDQSSGGMKQHDGKSSKSQGNNTGNKETHDEIDENRPPNAITPPVET